MLYQELLTGGFSEKEAKVYLAILELGEGNIAQITKKSGIKRATVYLEIESLKEKGLLSLVRRHKRTIYLAENPKIIQDKLEERKDAIARLMPELLSIANSMEKKPKVRYFEGDEGIKEIYRDTLKYPDQEILLWGSDDFVKYADEEYFLKHYVPRRVEKKIWVRAITVNSEIIQRYHEADQSQLRRMKIVDSSDFHFSTEIDLYSKNKIMVVAFQEKFGMIIESEKIFETLKNIFEIMWMNLPEK